MPVPTRPSLTEEMKEPRLRHPGLFLEVELLRGARGAGPAARPAFRALFPLLPRTCRNWPVQL
jgi:hypothetical protein